MLLAIHIDFGKMTRWLGTFVEGTLTTLTLSLLTVLLGLLLSLLLTAMRRSRVHVLRYFSMAYTLVVRGTPILLQLVIWLYALPYLGISIPALPFLGKTYGSREFLTAVVALALNSAAYVAELLRGGLNGVDKGQVEASRSLGMSRGQCMRYVVIPQALRVILPGLGNEFVQMIKESSIVSTVGVFDIMYASNIIKGASYTVFEPLIIIAGIYLFLTTLLNFGLARLERKLNVAHQS